MVLSPFETFLWGMVGALLAYIAIVLLPKLAARAGGETVELHLPWLIGLAIAYIIGGGLFALLIGEATVPKHAAFYGAGWDTGIKGISEGTILARKAINKVA